MNFLKKIFNYYSAKEPETLISNEGKEVRKVEYYDTVDQSKSARNHAEVLKNAIEDYKLPFDIVIDDNGDILEHYTVEGHPFSWSMKKHINDHNGIYQIIEEFKDSNDFRYRRVFNGLWCTEFTYTDEEGQTEQNFVKRDKKGNTVITKDTDELYKAFGEKVNIKNPIDFANYVDMKSVVYNHRKIYMRTKFNNQYDYQLQYITSLNPYNDGLQGQGLLNMDNNNLYDCDLIKK